MYIYIYMYKMFKDICGWVVARWPDGQVAGWLGGCVARWLGWRRIVVCTPWVNSKGYRIHYSDAFDSPCFFTHGVQKLLFVKIVPLKKNTSCKQFLSIIPTSSKHHSSITYSLGLCGNHRNPKLKRIWKI